MHNKCLALPITYCRFSSIVRVIILGGADITICNFMGTKETYAFWVECQLPTCQQSILYSEQISQCLGNGGPCKAKSKLNTFEHAWGGDRARALYRGGRAGLYRRGGGLGQGHPPRKHVWKQYLPETSLAGDKYGSVSSILWSISIYCVIIPYIYSQHAFSTNCLTFSPFNGSHLVLFCFDGENLKEWTATMIILHTANQTEYACSILSR